MVVTFIGHAKFLNSDKFENKILALLEKSVGDNSASFYLGGYGAFDEFAYECCKKYKKAHKSVSLIFVTPYITLSYQKNHLDSISTKYDGIIYPEIETKPLKYAIIYRNRWMIEKADLIICGISHTYGNAYKAYKYAKQKGKLIFNVFGCDI